MVLLFSRQSKHLVRQVQLPGTLPGSTKGNRYLNYSNPSSLRVSNTFHVFYVEVVPSKLLELNTRYDFSCCINSCCYDLWLLFISLCYLGCHLIFHIYSYLLFVVFLFFLALYFSPNSILLLNLGITFFCKVNCSSF